VIGSTSPIVTQSRGTSDVDLNDTSRCPLGVRCEACGAEEETLVVRTLGCPRFGTMCLTLCPLCASTTILPPVAAATAERLVAQHCKHLGIDRDAMHVALGRT
jgi:hypothetical protein